jgi:hypothetical protein
MHTIWKYQIEQYLDLTIMGEITRGNVVIPMPKGAEPLDVQVQYGDMYLWCIVDTDQPYVDTELFVVGTGHALPATIKYAPFRYIGTIQLEDGMWVFHVFWKGQE